MKYGRITLPLLVSVMAFADAGAPIVVTQHARPVLVDSVHVALVGSGFPAAHVTVTSTFGNECHVPRSKELVTFSQYSQNFDHLVISLGSISDRPCPAIHRPVTVTIGVGKFIPPNGGNFSKVIVNGKAALN